MKLYRGFVYRAIPTKAQLVQIKTNIDCARALYNFMLEKRTKYFDEHKKPLRDNYRDYIKEHPMLKDADESALHNAQRNLEAAFKRYFDKISDKPKFKSKDKATWTYTSSGTGQIKLKDNYLYLPTIGNLRLKLHRPFQGRIINVTVRLTRAGKVNVSILSAYEIDDVEKVTPKKYLGLAYSQDHLYVDSKGNIADYPQYYIEAEKRIARENRKLSKMEHKSNNWRKQRQKLAHKYEDVANKRKYFHHNLALKLAEEYDVIVVEQSTEIKRATPDKQHKIAYDNAWFEFTTILDYKLKERGKELITISGEHKPFFACYKCGSLAIEDVDGKCKCMDCGVEFDKEWNEAINIRNEGKRIIKSR